MTPLYEGSLIQAPSTPEDRLAALIAEHGTLRDLFVKIEEDADKKIDTPATRALCAAACAIPDIHNEQTVEAWGGDAVLEGVCAQMMRAVKTLIADPKVRFGDDAIYPALIAAVERTEPAVWEPYIYLSPV